MSPRSGYRLRVTKRKRIPRARTLVRADARRQQRLHEDREKLRLLEPGGSPERPLEVSSVSVVEARAEAERCFQCDLPMRVEEHATRESGRGLVRAVRLCCPRCAAPREIFLRIAGPSLN